VADVVHAEFTLIASDSLAVKRAESLRERGGEYITQIRQKDQPGNYEHY
jgi:hypothetical protein